MNWKKEYAVVFRLIVAKPNASELTDVSVAGAGFPEGTLIYRLYGLSSRRTEAQGPLRAGDQRTSESWKKYII